MTSLFDTRPCPGECGEIVRGDKLSCQSCWLDVPQKQRNALSVKLIASDHNPPYKDPELVDEVIDAVRAMVGHRRTQMFTKRNEAQT